MVGVTHRAGRLLAVYLVGLVGLALLATSTGFVGTAAAGNTAPDCSTVSYSTDGSGNLEVSTIDELQCINENHDDATSRSDALSKDYKLVADIDASGTSNWDPDDDSTTEGFDPIGDSGTKFTGTFDGAGYEVSGLTISRSGTNYVGAFGYIESGALVTDVTFASADITGGDQTGGVAGRNAGGDIIETRVTGSVSGDRYTGGVVGLSGGVVRRSGSTASVSGSGNQAGGLVGENRNLIEQSYATGSVSGSFDVGGLVGKNDNGDNVKSSFATGSVSGSSTLGGLVGNNAGSVSNSYWDADVNSNGQDGASTGSFDATGLTTTQMQRFAPQSNMGDLDFETVWIVTSGYPRLAWEGATALTVDSIEATSPTVGEDESGTITVTAKESGTDAGEGVTVEVLDDDGLAGFAASDTKVTDTNGEVEFTFDEPDHGSYSPEFAWADDTSVSVTPTVTVQDAPEVTSIERASGESNPTNADSVDFDVTFSESVSGVDDGDFTLHTTDSASGTVQSFGPTTAGNSITVTVDSISGDGDIRLDLDDDDGITNGNSVPLSGEGTSGGSGDGSFTSGESFTVDNTNPGFSAGSSNSASVDEESTASDFLDVDAGDDGPPGSEVSTYALSSAAGSDAGPFSIDSSSGQLSLDSAQDFENPADDNGDGDYELDVTATDDAGNTAIQSVTVSITDVNDPPTLDTNSGVTVDEGSNANQIPNSELDASDQDGDSITYTVTASLSAGDLFIDGSGGGTDDGTLDGESPIAASDSFTQANIDNGNLLYNHDGSETTSDDFDFDLSDGNGGSVTGKTFSITVDPVNDAPTLAATGTNPSYTEDGSAVTLYMSASASTVESGQQLTDVEMTVSNVAEPAQETLTIDGEAVTLTDGNSGTTAANSFGYSVTLSGGTATVTVSKSATPGEYETLINGLQYEHTGDDPSTGSDRVVKLTQVTDSGGTANGGEDTTNLDITSTVSLSAVNDAPTLSVSTSNPTFTEGGSAAEPFSSASTDVVESGQQVERLTLTVNNVADGSAETLTLDGSSVALTDGNSVNTANNGLSASVSASSGTATVTVSGGFSESTANTVLDTLAYRHTGDDPSTSNDRTITITEIVDDGGTSNGGSDTASVSKSGTVSLTPVNDAPTAISLTSTSVAQSSGTDAVVGSLSATDVDDSSHTFSLVSGSGDGDNIEFNIDGGDLRANDASALAEGDYDVRLEANDGNGGTYEKAVTVSVTDDLAPTIASSTPADDATGVARSDDITITFSEDIAFGSGTITLHEDDGGFSDWETFDVSSDTGSGDGTVSISGSTLRIDPSTALAGATTYAVQIDAGALTDTASSTNDFGGIGDDTTLSFTTTDSTAPTASVGSDRTIDEGQSVSFDGTGSTDNVGIVSYDWDFDDGDTASGATTSHTFDSPGTYTVELTVTDAAGNTDTATVEVTVESTGGGSSSLTADAGSSRTVTAGEKVTFDGSDSTSDSGITSYEWDFGDGESATGETVTHTFEDAATVLVELTVSDGSTTDTDTISVTVERASEDEQSDDSSESGGSSGSDGGGSAGSSGSSGSGGSGNESSGPTETGGDQPTADDSSGGTGTVVSGTRSEDGSVTFTVSASDDDGPIKLDLSGTDADSSDTPADSSGNETDEPNQTNESETDASGAEGQDESDGSDDSEGEGEGENAVSVDSLSITPSESGSREFDISVREWEANTDTSERGSETDDTGTDTTAPDNQGATDSVRNRTDPRTFLVETGSSPIGYVEVTHTNPDTDIDSVTFRFRIRKAALNETGVDPSGVALYRDESDGWTRLPTDEVGANATHYVFEGTSPGLSLFTIASTQPAFEVVRASSQSETRDVSEPVTVDATVRNLGGAAGTYTAELRANGTVVATSDVDLASNSTRTVSLSFTPADSREYTLTVGTVSAGTVSVQSDETLTESTPADQETTQQTTAATDKPSQTAGDTEATETTDASGPGFGVPAAFGAFLMMVVLRRRRS